MFDLVSSTNMGEFSDSSKGAGGEGVADMLVGVAVQMRVLLECVSQSAKRTSLATNLVSASLVAVGVSTGVQNPNSESESTRLPLHSFHYTSEIGNYCITVICMFYSSITLILKT